MKDWKGIPLKGLATDKQKALMIKLGIEFGGNITKQGASDKITIKLEEIKTAPKVNPYRDYTLAEHAFGRFDNDEVEYEIDDEYEEIW